MPRWPIKEPGRKVCPRCKQEQPLEAFAGQKRKDSYCRPCKAANKRESCARQAERPDLTAPARFWPKVIKDAPNGCWHWKAAIGPDGYPRFTYKGQTRHAHRVAMILSGVDVPDDMDVDHCVCRDPACINPAHMRVVPKRVNALENNDSPMAKNARATHCIRGHPFSPENTSIHKLTRRYTRHGRPSNKGYETRVCLTCKRERYHRLKHQGGRA